VSAIGLTPTAGHVSASGLVVCNYFSSFPGLKGAGIDLASDHEIPPPEHRFVRPGSGSNQQIHVTAQFNLSSGGSNGGSDSGVLDIVKSVNGESKWDTDF